MIVHQNMPYKCSKCGKEFVLKCRFRGHMRRQTPCVTQTSLDSFKRLACIVQRRYESGCSDANYFQNRLDDLNLYYNNLTDEEKPIAKSIFDGDLKFILNEVKQA